MSPLGLYFLGPPEVRLDHQLVTFPTRKSTALLAYLAVTGQSHARDTLAALLWPEMDQKRARSSLRHGLWILSWAALGDWLEATQEFIGMRTGYSLDVAVFHEKLAQSQAHGHSAEEACSVCQAWLTEAAKIYRDDFLAGFSLRDSPEFDDWQRYQAESLRQELSYVLERLISLHSASGDWEPALSHARRWVTLDPLHEPAHRSLMRLYALTGKRGLALKQYETLSRLLTEELGIETEEDSQILYDEIRENRINRPTIQPIPVSPEPIDASLIQSPPPEQKPVIQATPVNSDIFTRTDTFTKITQHSPLPPEAKARIELRFLLNKVKNFWVEGVLKNSVHGAVLLDLGKQFDLEAVDHPWGMVLEIPDRQSQAIPQNSKIFDIFNQTNRALLILGEPGSGKTTTLIELARDLIQAAESDETYSQPVPVIFNLSSWVEHKSPLLDWMSVELSKKYHIPRQTGKAWLEANWLILLMDGLDEVEAKHRAGCIDAINTFIETYGVAGIAICSRVGEYLIMPRRLRLYGAMRLLPLSPGQVQEYLTRAGFKVRDFETVGKTNDLLHEFISTPLILSITALAYRGLSAETLFTSKVSTSEDLRKQLFDTYIGRMIERRGKSSLPYQGEQTRAWLAWLANGMMKHNQTIFLIEDLQPGWLDKKKRLIHFLFSRTIASLIFIMGFALIGILRNLAFYTVMLWIGGLIAGLTVGFLDGFHFEYSLINPYRKRLSLHWGLVIQFILVTIIGGVIFGVFDLSSPMLFHPLLGVAFGSVFGLLKNQQGKSQDIQTVELTGFSVRGALKGLSLGLLIVGLYYLLISVQKYFLPAQAEGILNRVDPLSVGLGGIFGSLGGAILGGLSSSKILIKVFPNQGIHISLKKAIFPGFVLGFSFGLLWVFLEHQYETYYKLLGYPQLTPYETYDRVFYLATALLFGSTLFLWYGGFDVIKHYTLRLILTLSRITPWQYARFLDYASHQIFLQKIGGGYSFIHRYLMEHFAGIYQTAKS